MRFLALLMFAPAGPAAGGAYAAAWIGMAGTLGGYIIGSVSEYFRTRRGFQRERSWDLFREDQRRLEKLYLAVEQVRDSYASSVARIVMRLTHDFDPGENSTEQKVPWVKLRMLVHMYAPELKDHLTRVEAIGEKLGEHLGYGILASREPPERRKRFAELVIASSRALGDAVDAMGEAIILHGGALTATAKSVADYDPGRPALWGRFSAAVRRTVRWNQRRG